MPVLASPFILKDKYETKDDLPPQNISGKVTGQNNEPLAGVTVAAKGTQRSVTTAVDGTFSLEVPDGVNILVFSYVGMQTQEAVITGKTSLSITLTAAADAAMSDVVVIGYGSQKRASVTG
ncbi:carboxypeptidase-like regulatory domain-containing protein, partial [Bradyrhizobium sp. NBAIM08]|nr:carboxypeptidase-like regulatory domain-containing protein [Bradyrhizobium sp. NBAIM08]